MAKDYASLTRGEYQVTSTAPIVGICKGCKYLGTDLFRSNLYCSHSYAVVPTSMAFYWGGVPVPVDRIRISPYKCSLKEPQDGWFKRLWNQWFRKN